MLERDGPLILPAVGGIIVKRRGDMHAEEVFDVGDWVERKDGNALWGDVYRAQVRRSTSDLVVFGEEYKWQRYQFQNQIEWRSICQHWNQECISSG